MWFNGIGHVLEVRSDDTWYVLTEKLTPWLTTAQAAYGGRPGRAQAQAVRLDDGPAQLAYGLSLAFSSHYSRCYSSSRKYLMAPENLTQSSDAPSRL